MIQKKQNITQKDLSVNETNWKRDQLMLAPFAYCLHRIILNENGDPIDYVILEANEMYEKTTGLDINKILNKRISEVLPEIFEDETDWVKIYGEIALKQTKRTFEQYSSTLKKTYKICVFSPEKYYFSTFFSDITPEATLTDISHRFNQISSDNIDYAEILDEILRLSGASYAAFNKFDTNGETFKTIAISGLSNHLKKAFSIIGFNPENRTWEADPVRYDHLIHKKTIHYQSLIELTRDIISPAAIKTLQKTFSLGEIYIIKTSNNEKIIGDVTLIFKKGVELKNQHLVETYTGLLGSLISRIDVEEDLKIREQNFREFFNNILDLVFVTNYQGKIITANQALLKRLNYTLSEVVDKSFHDIYPKEYQNKIKSIVDETLNIKDLSNNIPFATKDGSMVSVETRITKGLWNNENCIIFIAYDLSREQEAVLKFNKVFHKNPAAMIISSFPDMVIQEVNKMFLLKTGLTKESTIDKNLINLGVLESNDQQSIFDFLKSKTSFQNHEIKINTQYEKKIKALVSGHLINNLGKKYLLMVIMDITPLKDAEEEVKNANRAKSQFLANMSHEIRTPLNAIIGFTELLIKSDIEKKYLNYINYIRTGGDTLLNVVNDILDFSKIEQGKIEITEEKTDIIRLTEESAELISFSAAKKGIEFILNIPGNVPRYAIIDPFRVKQILTNLLANAVKFTDVGEIELSLEFSTNNNIFDQGSFLFTVRDTGIGIPPENKEKIFKAFSQGDLSITRKYGGTGLGLVISESLARKMESTITFDSHINEGTTFSFLLKKPYLFEKNQKEHHFPDLKNVLVCCKNRKNARVLQHLLRLLHIESEIIRPEFLSDFSNFTNEFDILMLDHKLISIDFPDIQKIISEKHLNNYEKIPGIIVLADASELNKTLDNDQYSSFNILKKPFNRREVLKCIQDFCNKYQKEHIKKIQFDNSPFTDTTNQKKYKKKNTTMKAVILTVEDFSASKQLIRLMISNSYPDIFLIDADNGVEAVKMAVEHKPDIIFMDIHMPLKDGYTATREIKEASLNSEWKPKIVALTADVTSDIKEKCAKAGMDHYMKKPFSLLDMKKYINEVLKIEEKKIEPVIESQKLTLINHDKNTLLNKIGNDEKVYQELISLSVKQIEDELKKLDILAGKYLVEEIVFSAHSIKGIGLNMYFNNLATIAKKIELQQFSDKDALYKLLDALKTEYRQLKAEFKKENMHIE